MAELNEDSTKEINLVIDRLGRLPRKVNEPASLNLVGDLLPTFIILFGLGSVVSFSAILTMSKNDQQHNSIKFASLAWLFFTVGFGLTYTAIIHQVYRSVMTDRQSRRISFCNATLLLWVLLQVNAVLAYLFIALVVVGYTESVGWTAVGMTSFAGLALISAFILNLFR